MNCGLVVCWLGCGYFLEGDCYVGLVGDFKVFVIGVSILYIVIGLRLCKDNSVWCLGVYNKDVKSRRREGRDVLLESN